MRRARAKASPRSLKKVPSGAIGPNTRMARAPSTTSASKRTNQRIPGSVPAGGPVL